MARLGTTGSWCTHGIKVSPRVRCDRCEADEALDEATEILRKAEDQDAQRLAVAIEEWIAIVSETRLPDLRFHDWGTIVYVGPLSGKPLDELAASPDARAMLEWADERSGRRATLLMACVVLEQMGIKPPNTRAPKPADRRGAPN